MPVVPLDDFRKDLVLLSTGLSRRYNLIFQDPPEPYPGYMVRLDNNTISAFPFDVNEYPPSTPTV